MGLWASADLDNQQKDAQTFGGSKGAGGALEDSTRKRLTGLGAGQQQTQIPPWLQAQYDQQRQWAAQARGDQQNAYDLAMAQANGGVTPQQTQLAQSQQTANAALLGGAQMAGGGARGAASARGVAQGALGANQAGNAAQMGAQQQADMLQGQALAARAADALRGTDQQSLDAENQFAAQNAQNNLNWRDMNDAWRLWAATQGQKMDLAKMGMATFGQNADFQNFLRNQQSTNQAIGLGAQALGGAASAYGAYAKKPDDNMYSDERVKTDFAPSEHIADSFLDALKTSRATYNYTDPKYDASSKKGSRYLGIMAQSVEKVPEIGRGIVTEVDGVKRVETLPMLSAIAGSLGRLVERVEKVEKR